jgi:rubrerythrin
VVALQLPKEVAMTPAVVASTLEVLKVLAKLELAVAHFYAACAKAYPEDCTLWEGLGDEEQLHAAHLERMGQILAERPAEFERNRSFSVAAVQTFIAYADSATQRIRSLPIPKAEYPQILAVAQDIEKSILESKYGEVVKGTNPEFRSLVTELVTDTAAHRARLAAHATKLSARR